MLILIFNYQTCCLDGVQNWDEATVTDLFIFRRLHLVDQDTSMWRRFVVGTGDLCRSGHLLPWELFILS